MTADPPAPMAMEGDRSEGPPYRHARWNDEGSPPAPPAAHPVKDIVLPLAVVIGLLANALLAGIAWGRIGQRMDTNEATDGRQNSQIEKLDERFMDLRDGVRDLTRDLVEDRRKFDGLEDYTRGRIDRLPYHPAPSPRR